MKPTKQTKERKSNKNTRQQTPEKLAEIAEYIRQHGRTRTAKELGISWPVIEFVEGEMSLGRLGGI